MRYVVARVDEIPPGGRRIVEVAGRSIGVFNLGDRFVALRNRCPHQGGPLCEGRLLGALEADLPGAFRWSPERAVLACPWHGWEFDLVTGRSRCDPSRLRAARYEAYVVETYPLRVEDRSVVVEVRS